MDVAYFNANLLFHVHAADIFQLMSVLQRKMNEKPHGENVLARNVDSHSDILDFLGSNH